MSGDPNENGRGERGDDKTGARASEQDARMEAIRSSSDEIVGLARYMRESAKGMRERAREMRDHSRTRRGAAWEEDASPEGDAFALSGNGAAPEGDASRGDALRGDAARGDAARGDALRDDAARGDAPDDPSHCTARMMLDSARQMHDGARSMRAVASEARGSAKTMRESLREASESARARVAARLPTFDQAVVMAVLPDTPDWEALAEFADGCSWRAGPALARRMRAGAFLPEERVFALAVPNLGFAGFCTLTRADCIPDAVETPWIGFLYVDEDVRGHRFSKRLIDAAADCARGQGHPRVWLATREEGLYEKFGFTDAGERRDDDGQMSRVFWRDT